ncbi:hypothetical protein KQ302_03520 [Synechococcus sp. CS-602]|uniref:hypothetical protein n=1 Tax=Synechococcaceae TaxID=1890426 RepID=UPI0008FF67E2|nr:MULTISPECIES: hypothetical protein [Synechococcaceae]MCT4365979.1 hypothetical protein [Candidatus Regnicoccus frigidus MAG-AL1]APD47701.1 hypothetical protein BM449_04740 [Synechococcus sp. SynAce01]MCT0201442.1 hypothetical protein [Synechococcus sp. CS-603]MCT0204188.1 hypothetical protein [Synechococcus sp. CS-602]MCT0247315.1 hypothetical protein [Synechococcus sp. CS-601]
MNGTGENGRTDEQLPAGALQAKAAEILTFWFEQTAPRSWFVKDQAFDRFSNADTSRFARRHRDVIA